MYSYNIATMQNLFDLYVSLRESFGQKLYLHEEKMTYAEVMGLAFRRAKFLQDKGYKNGDIVAILSHNSADWIITYIACTALGLITLLLDTNLTHALYQKYLDLVETKAVFVSDKFSHHYQHVETFDIDLKHCLADTELTLSTATRKDISTMLYTSGTSAEPKVVGLTHNNIIEGCRSNAKHVELVSNDVFLSILPFYHAHHRWGTGHSTLR
jgi:long-subunit acyl-CoA synthetase (AMP-forming)